MTGGSPGHAPAIAYATWESAWTRFNQVVGELIADPAATRVCEVGAGAKPCLRRETAAAAGIQYTLVDGSAEELAKGDAGDTLIEANVTSAEPLPGGPYDVIVSRFLAEHVAEPARFHRKLFDALNPGGSSFHFFSTLYAPQFVANRLLPEAVSDRILRRISPDRDEWLDAKFPAYYRWCRGPTKRQLERFASVGFEVTAYTGFFGAPLYYRRVPPLQAAEQRLCELLARRPVPALTTYSHVRLRRPN